MSLLLTTGLGGDVSSLITLGMLDFAKPSQEYYVGIYSPYEKKPVGRLTEYVMVSATIVRLFSVAFEGYAIVRRVMRSIVEHLHVGTHLISPIKEYAVVDEFTAPATQIWEKVSSEELEESIENDAKKNRGTRRDSN